eukprot:TRINITY_DN441_c0_g1_i15.p1 TRINITY_DN441_c0_g1~~TRINITY_DN441_c0_g1_i15.p1  ORF type:complete len:267 (-),score=66.69 TRINITY_DN441_c0_g1_i15:376-1176(-)
MKKGTSYMWMEHSRWWLNKLGWVGLIKIKESRRLCRILAQVEKFGRGFEGNFMDFEKAHHLGIKQILPNYVLIGCSFHLISAVHRWLKKKGMEGWSSDNYAKRKTLDKDLHILILTENKEDFEKSKEIFLEKYQEDEQFLKYFLKNYLSDNARFPPSIWAKSQMNVKQSDLLDMTNNFAENANINPSEPNVSETNLSKPNQSEPNPSEPNTSEPNPSQIHASESNSVTSSEINPDRNQVEPSESQLIKKKRIVNIWFKGRVKKKVN